MHGVSWNVLKKLPSTRLEIGDARDLTGDLEFLAS